MKLLLLASLLIPAAAYAAPEHHAAPRAPSAPSKTAGHRTVGVHITAHPDKPFHAKDNPGHDVVIHDPKTNKDEHHVVVVDHRPAHIVAHDPHVRVIARGYHPTHEWSRFHRAHGGWFTTWGINAWTDVGTVTCEAVNESNGEFFPVTEDRDARGWDDDTVNTILDQALDDCMAEAGGAVCGPATPSCSFQPY
ncbi:MAG TPA: hypothetical protein VGM88_15495 [Kofleriaceae bacterium]|jgi:hypothetical protein